MKNYNYRRKPGSNNLTLPKNMLRRQQTLREVHPLTEGIPADKPANKPAPEDMKEETQHERETEPCPGTLAPLTGSAASL